jgi:hypothetical protein
VAVNERGDAAKVTAIVGILTSMVMPKPRRKP